MPGIDLTSFSDACQRLYAPGLHLKNYASRSFAFLRRLVPAEFGGCGSLDHGTRCLSIGFDTEYAGFSSVMEAYGAVMNNYPIYNFDPTVNGGRPFRRSQFFSDRQFRQLDIFSEVYRPLGVDNHCALHVPTREGETTFFFLERGGGPDFSDRDMALLTEAQAHLANAHALGRAFEAWGEDPVCAAAALVAAGLTPREADTLVWICQGKSNVEVAVILGISLHTVKDHVASIFDKAGVGNRLAAIIWARDVCRRAALLPQIGAEGFVVVPTS